MSKFEVVTAMAFAAFADAPIDVAVVEVGLGGRWDATNVINAPVAVITPIGIDHVDYLGDTVAEIAGEKAGIITKQSDDLVPTDTVVVIARQPQDAMDVLLAQAVRADAAVAREDSEFAVLGRQVAVGGQLLELQGLGGTYTDVFLPLHGEHQAHNAVVALAAVEALFGAGAQRQLDIDAVRAGFAAVNSPGRLERMRSAPTVFIDAAHNPAGAAALAQALGEEFDFRFLVGVVSVMADKDVDGILAALESVLDQIVVTHNGSPRALDVETLALKQRTVSARSASSSRTRCQTPSRRQPHWWRRPPSRATVSAAWAVSESSSPDRLSPQARREPCSGTTPRERAATRVRLTPAR